MIELTLYEYMKAALAPTPVYLTVPADPPETFVFMEKTGSGEENRLKNATFAFQSHGPTLYAAATLNEEVKEEAAAAVALPEITSVKLNTDYCFPDTQKKKHRYQAVFDIWHY